MEGKNEFAKVVGKKCLAGLFCKYSQGDGMAHYPIPSDELSAAFLLREYTKASNSATTT